MRDQKVEALTGGRGRVSPTTRGDVAVLDAKGMVRHDGGVVASPAMYLIGAAFLRRRTSSVIDDFLDAPAAPARR
jgi:hypothetical protein